ncbi:tetratricopeptide repeat protein [Flavobacterium sp. MFBS3-15]|uniref:tetratricopeptide repeat protein n=1 Tax=Flavobacterium sp. MFBS3-15 TaxID=2989816 RepID=UPI0022364757|nr:tetratricopeptide repeat protein [Flavobacterium sp. MFBS3-15]MCW4470288.1 tetratricopeptide repeat protein [Flavobacterium sp. MFBS3-15]
MLYRAILLLSLFIPLIGFGQEPFDYKAAEARIKKHIFSSPDSTRIIIDEILERKDLHDSIRGTVHNIYGIYFSHMGQLDSSEVHYKRALAYLKSYPKIRTMPLMNFSVDYRNRGMYEESFRCLSEALEICKRLGLKDKEAIIYGNMSSNYQFMLNYDKAVEYSLKSIEILKQQKSPTLTSSTQKLANIYLKMENFTFARDLYEDCLKSFMSQKDIMNYTITLINYAEALLHLSEPNKAEKALREAIGRLKELKNPGHLAIAYSKLGNIAKAKGDLKGAGKNYKFAVDILTGSNSLNSVLIAAEYIEVLNMKEDYNEALRVIKLVRSLPVFNNVNREDKVRFDVAAAETFSKTNNGKEAIAGLVRAIKVKDSISKADAGKYSSEMQARFQAQLQREKNSALKAKNLGLQKEREAERVLMYVYIAVSFGIIVIILLFARSQWLRSRLHREQLKRADNERALLLKQHEHEKELTNAQKEIILEKERELASSALKMASYQGSLQQIVLHFDDGNIRTVAGARKELEGLMKQKDYLKQFETRFNALHPDFGQSLLLRYANLTRNDIEFCSLLKLNLSNKEIAQLLQISPESATTKKYRIKKKMGIPDDAEFEKTLSGI